MDLRSFSRFGVYFTPPSGPLAEFGASWLGWDVGSSQASAHPEIPGLPQPVADLTATPRKYGFHATLKPPFRLTKPVAPEAALEAFERVATKQRKVTLDGLGVARVGAFVAMIPTGEVTALNALAAACVMDLDYLRAPASEAELAKRRGSGLSHTQDRLLLKWGYPYVLEEFRFHMTLTGRLPDDDADKVQQILAPRLAQIVPGAICIDALTLVGEDADGRFHVIQRTPLRG